MHYKKLLLFSSLLFILYLAACGDEEQSGEEQENREIITSIYPIEYLVSEIAGDQVDVETVIPAGADAHVYEPSTRDMVEYADKDAFFYIGADMEAFAETMSETLSGEGVHTKSLAENESLFMEYEEEHAQNEDEHSDEEHSHDEEEHGDEEHSHDEEEEHSHSDEHDHDHDHGDNDPHFWLDPQRMIDAGGILLDELVTLYPELEEDFQANYEQFEEKMIELDNSYQEAFDGVDQHNILVAHKAFGYWEERYPIEQYAVRGLSSSQEPSQRELQELFETLEELKIDHIIYEVNRDDRLAETIADDLELEAYHLHTLETRTTDDVEDDKDYIDIMEENLETLIDTMNR
ncbi:metal ABC transporter solute-binding protein, Zn/Mn family [Halalkalibacillus halophilus]|uniref:metal ABC transporter solute-binding protein, Zn/Mn family n=1 Tax=Halalkalibacillus halophilus TaxID=392827 RepID=UPI000424F488|nr:zinc ABC transporter substrate-binding protein [Halalkalibacillus halophilus]